MTVVMPVCDIGEWVQPLDSDNNPTGDTIQVIDMDYIDTAEYGEVWVYRFREPYEHSRFSWEFIV